MSTKQQFHEYARQRRDRLPPDQWNDNRILSELAAAKRRLEYGVKSAAAEIAKFAAIAEGRGLL